MAKDCLQRQALQNRSRTYAVCSVLQNWRSSASSRSSSRSDGNFNLQYHQSSNSSVGDKTPLQKKNPKHLLYTVYKRTGPIIRCSICFLSVVYLQINAKDHAVLKSHTDGPLCSHLIKWLAVKLRLNILAKQTCIGYHQSVRGKQTNKQKNKLFLKKRSHVDITARAQCQQLPDRFFGAVSRLLWLPRIHMFPPVRPENMSPRPRRKVQRQTIQVKSGCNNDTDQSGKGTHIAQPQNTTAPELLVDSDKTKPRG